MLDNGKVKVIAVLILIFVMVSSSFAGIKVEAHGDHDHEETHAQDITYHDHDHVNKTQSDQKESQPDCPHFHIHCSSIVVGFIHSTENILTPLMSYHVAESFNHHALTQQNFPSSPYRPPIA